MGNGICLNKVNTNNYLHDLGKENKITWQLIFLISLTILVTEF